MQVTTTCTLQPAARVLSTRTPSVHRDLRSCSLQRWHACVTGLVRLVVAGGGLTTFLICERGGTPRSTVEDISRHSGSHTVSHGALADLFVEFIRYVQHVAPTACTLRTDSP